MRTSSTPPVTPQQAANEVLKAVGKTTVVSVEANVMVAGEPCYQLVLAPRDDRSLVGKVTIAIDAKYGVPLRVQVFAKRAASPSFQFGYTAIQFVAPAVGQLRLHPAGGRVRQRRERERRQRESAGGKESAPSGFGSYGKGWLTVVELRSRISCRGSARAARSPSSSAAPTGKRSVRRDGRRLQAVISNLIGAAKPVHGSWGSGTLLTTSLFSMLMTNGEVYIGAVEPSVLYAAVGRTSS